LKFLFVLAIAFTNPRARYSTIKCDPPYDINGIVVPVTGIIPRFIPTCTKKLTKKYIAIPDANNDSKFVRPFIATPIILYKIKMNKVNKTIIPTKPHSSPKAEKIKSVSASGKKESLDCVPSEIPLPHICPLPNAI
jgi:hypothetical protein